MEQILTILGSVGFNWHVALANFFNFLIILFLLNKFFFKKIGKTIDERHRAIEEGLNNARDAEIMLSRAEDEKADILRAARKEEASIIHEGEAKAKEHASRIVRDAESELAHKRTVLEQEEKNLSSKVEAAFNEKAPELIAKLYAKTLLRTMTEEENNALIARMK